DLRPARDAGLHAMTDAVVRDLLQQTVDEHRPFRARADEAHIAFQHIEELRDLVDPRAADEAADACDAAIVALGPAGDAVFLGIRAHAAELQHHERVAAGTDALLAIEDGTGAVELDGDDSEYGHRETEDEHDQRDHDIEQALGDVAGPGH